MNEVVDETETETEMKLNYFCWGAIVGVLALALTQVLLYLLCGIVPIG